MDQPTRDTTNTRLAARAIRALLPDRAGVRCLALVVFAFVLASSPPASAQEELPAPEPELEVVEFPYDEPPLWLHLLETPPAILTWPDEPLGRFFERILHTEHDHVETELDEFPLGLQPIPERPPLLLEWNEQFLAPGFLNQGIEIPTGAVWRPSLWVFGQFRTAVQYFDGNRAIDPVVEWTNGLDLFGQVNLSGTERVVVGLRPLDEEMGDIRTFTGYDFHNGVGTDGWNAKFQTLFFEGDFGEVFPRLDPFDTKLLDYGFSVGRMPLLAQQGLLINEDMIDAFTVTRNTLNGHGNLNLRMSGIYSWRNINRNSSLGLGNDFDPGSKMVALLTESDFAKRTVNADAVYVYGDPMFGDLFAFGLSSIRRFHGYKNTYNSSLHLLASFPEGPSTDYAAQGELLFAQFSWTPQHTEDLIYFNAFWAIDQYTSPARGPLQGGPLGQTGILFSGAGLGRYGAPINVETNNVAGASLGYQLFFNHTREQVIWEVGGVQDTDGTSRGALGTALRFQKALGQHFIFIVDGFVSKHEGQPTSQGARTELLIKF